MKQNSKLWLTIAACLALQVGSWSSVAADEIAWRQFPHTAQAEAQQTGRPLLVYVGADYCGYCRKLEQTTWDDARVARTVEGGFVPLHIDGQRDRALAARLGVRGFPAILVLSPDGRLAGRADGYQGPEDMQLFLIRHGVFADSRRTAER